MTYDNLQRIQGKQLELAVNGEEQGAQSYDWSYLYEQREHPYRVTRVENAEQFTALVPEYDDNGNITRKEAGPGVMNLAWDDENRVIEVKNESGDVSRYRYGHDGERAIKQTPDGTTHYINAFFTIRAVTGADGSQAVRSRVATKHLFAGSERIATKRATPEGTKLANNLFNKANCSAPANSVLAFFEDFFNRNATSCPNTDANASLIANAAAVTQETETYYYHADHLGSIGIVTKGGELYDYSVFLPFGEQWVYQSQNDASLNQGVNGEGLNPLSPFQFTGKELDKYTGLTYFGARYYDPRISVWMSADPIWEQYLGSNPKDLPNAGMFTTMNMNLYNYTAQNPINLVDRDGNVVESPWDLLNIGMGVVSLGTNLASGNLAGAALDAVGIVADTAAAFAPGIPGGAGTAIKTARAANKAAEGINAADKAVDGAKSATKVAEGARKKVDTLQPGPFAKESIPSH